MAEGGSAKPSNNTGRDEKVMIIPHGSGFIAVPPYKVVSRGDTITFRAFGCAELDIKFNSNTAPFDPPARVNPTVVTVQVHDHAADDVYPYQAICRAKVGDRRGKRARGRSDPGVIVDG